MHSLSTLKCKHCSLFKIYVVIFKHIESFKYPGYTLEFQIPRVLLAITQGNPGLLRVFSFKLVEYKNNLRKIPWVLKTQGIFGRLFLYSANITENTQGNSGLPRGLAQFQQNPVVESTIEMIIDHIGILLVTQGIPCVLKT